MANLRKLVSGRWVATWTTISGQIGSYELGPTVGLFVFTDDGKVTGQFRFKQGIEEFHIRPFEGTFDVFKDSQFRVIDGIVTVNIENGNTNTLSFVRVNSNELAFVVMRASKTADPNTRRTLMAHGTLHRISTPWWWYWPPYQPENKLDTVNEPL